MRFHHAPLLLLLCAAGSIHTAGAQEMRLKDVRELGKQGSVALPELGKLLKNPDTPVRVEAVRQITDIGTLPSLDLLIEASRDNDPEVQIRAVDGLVNFYVAGYVKTGIGASITRVGTSIKSRFTDTNDQIVDAFVPVRPEVIAAIGTLVRGGNGMEVRASAARAVGILRGKAAVPDLILALRTKNTDVLYESLVALQKIHDESAGPRIRFLLRDPEPKVQVAAIETVGVLRATDAVPDLLDALKHASSDRVRRAALGSLAMLPDEASRPIYQKYLTDKDEKMRAGAAEGFARLRKPSDLPAMEKAYESEGKTAPRLSLAFAQVMLGHTMLSEFSPLQFVINNLNSSAYKGIAEPFLEELAHDARVRQSLYESLTLATKSEKIGIAQVLGKSGDKTSLPYLDKLSKDTDSDVAQEGVRAVRTLQARLK